MTPTHRIEGYLTRYPHIAALFYAALVIMFSLTILVTLMDLGQQYRAVNESAEILARLQARRPLTSPAPAGDASSQPVGSPFLEGQTVTVASAALLQRATSAITSAGGSVVSSEVGPQGAQSKDGYVRIVATCELEQSSLQRLLYDIEAGMPFLFVDQLVAQAPGPASEGGRMRVLLGISGLWRIAK
jgi:general secretion pathway protein M